jgi:hemerythrin
MYGLCRICAKNGRAGLGMRGGHAIAVGPMNYACSKENAMANSIQWSDEYCIDGNIDNEHRRLFGLANNVFEIIEPNLHASKLKDTVNALYEYMQFHFGNEQRLMYKIGYPEYEQQLAMHKTIIANLNALMTSSRSLAELHSNLQHLMIDSLLAHILREDRKIGTFIQRTTPSRRKV